MKEITSLLSRIDSGDPAASAELLPLVYTELRKLAASRVARERPGYTLDATALVHEAYLKITKGEKTETWDSRGHFFSAAAEAMRRILIDRARAKKRVKRGGDVALLDIEINCPANCETPDRLLEIDEAVRATCRPTSRGQRVAQVETLCRYAVKGCG